MVNQVRNNGIVMCQKEDGGLWTNNSTAEWISTKKTRNFA